MVAKLTGLVGSRTSNSQVWRRPWLQLAKLASSASTRRLRNFGSGSGITSFGAASPRIYTIDCVAAILLCVYATRMTRSLLLASRVRDRDPLRLESLSHTPVEFA